MNFPIRRHNTEGVTRAEALALIGVLFVLIILARPVYLCGPAPGGGAMALSRMRQFGGALASYMEQNDHMFPAEGAMGSDTWANATKPENTKVWYNALPRILGARGVGGYAADAREFYTTKNLLFLPAATYPKGAAKLGAPLFAIAINTELFRKDHEGKEKVSPKVTDITDVARTVAFLEQGLPTEKKALPSQPNYDGSCKGSAKSFVARYGGKGTLSFVDGHAESVSGKDVLTETGKFYFPQTNIIWTKTPDEDPNNHVRLR